MKNIRASFLILLLFVAFGFTQDNQEPPAPAPNPPDSRPPGGQQQPQHQLPGLDQGRKETTKVSGRVMPANGEYHLPPLATVTIASLVGGYRQTQMVRADGGFELRDVPRGSYVITLESPGYETSQQSVGVENAFGGQHSFVFLTMGKRLEEGDKVPANPSEKIVSASVLAIPKEALKELDKAAKESENKKPEKAIEHLQKAIKVYPKFHQAYNNLAVQYFRMGKLEDAVQTFQNSIEVKPENPMAYRNLGLIYLQQGDYPKALEFLLKSIELEPNHAQALMFLGDTYFGLRQYVLALTSFQNALKFGPQDKNLYLRMGQCYVEINHPEEAKKHFELFLAAEPSGERAARVRLLMAQLQ